jgi:acetyltransferase-like isoleucine patch superfamily enzyme
MFESKKGKNIISRIKFKLVSHINFNSGNVFIAKGSRISSITTIGDFTRINGPIVIKGRGTVKIGRLCAIGDGVRIITQNHDMSELLINLNVQEKILGKGHVTAKSVCIADNVWIGDNVIILPGVKIAHGAVIAAGAVVTKNVSEFEIVGGNPAKLIRTREPIGCPSDHEECFYNDIVEKLNAR